MSYCIKCHRPLRLPSPDGYGPVCRKTAKPLPTVDRDLFGFDVPAAARAAVERIVVHVQQLAIEAHVAVRREFAAARRRLGIWSAA